MEKKERKGRRGEAIVNRILQNFFRKQRALWRQLPRPQGHPNQTFLCEISWVLPERILGACGRTRHKWTALNFSWYRKPLGPQTKLRTKQPRAPNSNSNKFPVVESGSWIKFLPSWKKAKLNYKWVSAWEECPEFTGKGHQNHVQERQKHKMECLRTRLVHVTIASRTSFLF